MTSAPINPTIPARPGAGELVKRVVSRVLGGILVTGLGLIAYAVTLLCWISERIPARHTAALHRTA
jgi:hypothetical protein